MSWSILLLPLLGGYYFLTRSINTQHTYRRLERQRLIFDSLIYGFIFLLIAYAFWSAFRGLFPKAIDRLPEISSDLSFLYPSLLAFLLAIAWTTGFNLYKRKSTENIEKWYLARAIENSGNAMQKDLLYSHFNSQFLVITLRNAQVYVGQAIHLDEPEGQSYIRILAVYRGYLDQNFKVVLDTDYFGPNSGGQTGTVLYEEEIISTTLYTDEELNQFIRSSSSLNAENN